jgi:mannose-6-phosphate isomerase
MYPIKFLPKIKKMIWGSESWEVTCRPNEMGVIANGEFAGMKFSEFIEKNPHGVLGRGIACQARNDKVRFPLLVKIIDAREALSVQVHPCDEYAKTRGNGTDTGKSEMWYILEPPTDGKLIVGLKAGVTREILAQAYENGTVEECLHRKKVQRGDIVNIPAGLIHALTPGVVVAEVQQNSDITYRLYDFGRVGADGNPRELHVQDALAVTNFSDEFRNNPPLEGHFHAEKLELSAPQKTVSNSQAFSVYTAVENSAIFETPAHTVVLEERQSVFIPAALGEFVIRPHNKNVTLLYAAPICPTAHNILVGE